MPVNFWAKGSDFERPLSIRLIAAFSTVKSSSLAAYPDPSKNSAVMVRAVQNKSSETFSDVLVSVNLKLFFLIFHNLLLVWLIFIAS